jgi:hypothetical protein
VDYVMTKKKPNVQDATRRNIRASYSRDATILDRLRRLERRVTALATAFRKWQAGDE